MPKTLMRGLTLLETIDLRGPMSVMELSRHSCLDKSIVSRTVTALEQDGWVVRHGAKIEVGPRAALLGHTSQASRAVRRAEPLVHAIAGVTGLLTQAYGLVGTRAVVLASAGGRGVDAQAGLGSEVPLYVTAAGKTIAAQLEPSDLDRRLVDGAVVLLLGNTEASLGERGQAFEHHLLAVIQKSAQRRREGVGPIFANDIVDALRANTRGGHSRPQIAQEKLGQAGVDRRGRAGQLTRPEGRDLGHADCGARRWQP